MQRKSSLAAIAISMLMSNAAMADQSSPAYLGVDVGRSAMTCTNCGSNTGFGLFAGYKFQPNIAAEFAARRFTKDGETSNFIDVALIPSYRLNPKTDLLGKFGVRSSSIKTDKDSLSGSAVVYGAGLAYQFERNLSVRAMLDFSPRSFGQPSTGMRSLNMGVSYQF